MNLPISFDPAPASVLSLQFSLMLPPGLSTGTITPGELLVKAGKGVRANWTGRTRTWTFIVFGLNQNAIGAGPLLTAQLLIAPKAAARTLKVPLSGAVYSDPKGVSIPPGASKAGTVTVLKPS